MLDWYHLRLLVLCGQRMWLKSLNYYEWMQILMHDVAAWIVSFLHVTSNIVTLSVNVSLMELIYYQLPFC